MRDSALCYRRRSKARPPDDVEWGTDDPSKGGIEDEKVADKFVSAMGLEE